MPQHQSVPAESENIFAGSAVILDTEGIQEGLIETAHDFANLTLADFTEPHLARMSKLLAEMSSQVAQAQTSLRVAA